MTILLNMIQLPELPTGMYILNLENAKEGKVSRKIMKKIRNFHFLERWIYHIQRFLNTYTLLFQKYFYIKIYALYLPKPT